MKRNHESPWNPATPVAITPTEFELHVRDWLARGVSAAESFEIIHQGTMAGQGGAYSIDVLATVTLFQGARVIVLAECKHQQRPVERDEILVLEGKLRDVGAHKGMLFSTAGFQRGAIALADARGIATVAVIDGRFLYETKSIGPPPSPPEWVRLPRFAGQRLTPSDGGVLCHLIDHEQVDAIREFLEGAERTE
jgi:restriction system protein